MNGKRFFRSLLRGTISFLRRLWNWFRHNFGMKIAAVVFAFILWSYVLVTNNPLRDKTITNLPVQVTNAALLQERSLALVEDIASNVKVRVVVQANNDRLTYITEDNVTVTADLSGITQEGEYRLELSASTQYGSVRRVSPSYINVNAETLVTKIVSITADTPAAPDGQWAADASLYPQTVTISGASSLVSRVDSAQVVLKEEDVSENVVASLPLTLYDADGRAVGGNIYKDTSSAVLTMHYYPTARVPIELDSEITAADGYQIKNVRLLNETALIAAPSHVLEGIESIATQKLSAADLDGDVLLETTPILPDGVEHISPSTIKVRVNVEEQTASAALSVPVTVRRGSAVVQSLSVSPVSVTVSGYRSHVAAVSASDIEITADVSGLSAGQSAPLTWQWVGKDAMPQDLEVSVPETAQIRAQ